MPSTRTSTRERVNVVSLPATEWHNERTILGVRAPIVSPASDEYLSRVRASYEERPRGPRKHPCLWGEFRAVGEKPEGKEGAIIFIVLTTQCAK